MEMRLHETREHETREHVHRGASVLVVPPLRVDVERIAATPA